MDTRTLSQHMQGGERWMNILFKERGVAQQEKQGCSVNTIIYS